MRSQTQSKRVEGPKGINQPKPKKSKDQGLLSEKALNKSSSRVSAKKPPPLVDEDVLKSLSLELTFLHDRVALFADDPMTFALPRKIFHYDKDASELLYLFKEDVKEFLSGAMLNISLIQVCMRYFN